MDQNANRDKLFRKIKILKAELEERKRSLPAHSVRPHQLLALEELENEVGELEEKLRIIESETGSRERP